MKLIGKIWWSVLLIASFVTLVNGVLELNSARTVAPLVRGMFWVIVAVAALVVELLAVSDTFE